jgi:RNA polymerase sigma-70 factor (sigma-E family)
MSWSVPGDAMPLRRDSGDGALPQRGECDRVAVRWEADRAVTTIYRDHYRSLVRLAYLLVADTATAEDVVQDAFVAMHGAWRRVRDPDKGLSYLRQSVVNRSRSVLRHRGVAERHAPRPIPDAPSAEHSAFALLERSKVIEALSGLPARQREVLVLKFYAGLGGPEIATALGISQGAVKSHTSRAMAAMRAALAPGP